MDMSSVAMLIRRGSRLARLAKDNYIIYSEIFMLNKLLSIFSKIENYNSIVVPH